MKEVEDSLDCLAVYPQIIRIAVWDEAHLADRKLYEQIGDLASQDQLQLIELGYFVHQ